MKNLKIWKEILNGLDQLEFIYSIISTLRKRQICNKTHRSFLNSLKEAVDRNIRINQELKKNIDQELENADL